MGNSLKKAVGVIPGSKNFTGGGTTTNPFGNPIGPALSAAPPQPPISDFSVIGADTNQLIADVLAGLTATPRDPTAPFLGPRVTTPARTGGGTSKKGGGKGPKIPGL